MEEYTLKTKVLAVIDYLRTVNTSQNDIVKEIVKTFNVSEDYVKSLLEAKPA